MVRAPFYDTNGVKKGAWSREEDDKLKDYIQRYGHWNWRELPKFAGLSRCGKSCRLRWMNYLRPDVKRGNYTKEEEDKIIKLHDDIGNKWSVIASHLPGRTDNEIKNYWHTHLKNRGKKNKKAIGRSEKNPNETSYEGNKSRESELESILASMPSLQILESSHLSPETPDRQIIESSPLSSESSSSTYMSSSPNYVPLPEMQWLSEDFVAVSDSYAQSSGDFWTEPFISDNSYFLNEYPSCLSPYNSDSMDFIYQEFLVAEHSAYL